MSGGFGRDSDKKISQHTETQAGSFLFEMKEIDPKALDMRTVIKTKEAMRACLYYGSLGDGYNCNEASIIKSLLERLLMSQDGFSRTNAVDVLRQNFPKKVEIEKGNDQGPAEL